MIRRCLLAALILVASVGVSRGADDGYYTSEQVYNSRPDVNRGKEFGHIGPTGVVAYINEGVRVTVESIQPGSPAAGKFAKGDVIVGVNGTSLKGLNPFVALGDAITKAEATDGRLEFDVESGEKTKQVAMTIPVMGSYAKRWPVDCEKSKKIIEQAAAFYHRQLAKEEAESDGGIPGVKDEDRGIPGALMCLYLLSTGDDRHLPVVKAYFKPFIANPQGIGEHTWNNGYNGIACAEYYLRTGDKEVLPVLQYYCDDAKRRQRFGCAWGHWGSDINPRYVAGGLMNPASSQVLTTLLLAKQCGVDVDDKTLLGALKFFYRFVGHGTVPYGDHRGEGGLGSNGKDGMIAAAMHVATHAKGDTRIYQSARDYLSMATLKSYPALAVGHADEGRGDGMWRGIAASYLKEKKPDEYRAMMDRLTWWVDLSRYHNGAMGMASCTRFNDAGSGAAVAMIYTAPLKTLQITGAPRSKYAVDFTLPERLWGREADLAFHGIDHNPQFAQYGAELAPHRLLHLMGNAYGKADVKTSGVTHEQMLQNVYHHRYMFRAQAAKALCKTGALGDIERLLTDPDPRVRRAALDGIIDWNYWFAMGKEPLKPEQYTSGTIEAIFKMINDPNEALYVIDGALFAVHNMPADVIQQHLDEIMPWTEHEEWWLRQASFMALSGLDKDPQLYARVLPRLIDMMVSEYHTQPRETMTGQLRQAFNRLAADSEARKAILSGYATAVDKSEVLPGPRSREGMYNVLQSVKQSISASPASAVELAKRLSERFDRMDTDSLIGIVGRDPDGESGFYPALEKLDEPQKQALTDLLHDVYLPELSRRLQAEKGTNLALIDTVLALKQLREQVAGWQPIGTPEPGQRVWQYMSIDPSSEAETMPRREKKRFRDIKLPTELKDWFKPEFDASKWQSGPAPIGVGEFTKGKTGFENRSPWGPGEFLLARTTFELEDPNYDLYRLRVLARQGFYVYLNGQRISTYIWWNDTPEYAQRGLGEGEVKLLKKGTNTLAIYTNVEYPSAMKPRLTDEVVGQADVYIEGLRVKDLK